MQVLQDEEVKSHSREVVGATVRTLMNLSLQPCPKGQGPICTISEGYYFVVIGLIARD